MTTLSFPIDPVPGQTFSAQNGKTYQFVNNKWVILTQQSTPIVLNTAFNRNFATNEQALLGESNDTIMTPLTTKKIILSWSIVNTDTTVEIFKGCLIDASLNPINLTLPETPNEGDLVGLCDAFYKATTNSINIIGLIESVQNLHLDLDGSGFILCYVNSVIGWKIISEIGIGGSALPSYTQTDANKVLTINPTGDDIQWNIVQTDGTGSVDFETNILNIKMNGSASLGSLSTTTVPRSDHVHPTDTSRAATTHNHTITDLPVATNQEAIDDTNTTKIMTPSTTKLAIDEFASAGTGSLDFETNTTNIKSNGSVSVGTLDTVPRSDHVHPTDTSRAATTHNHSGTDITTGTINIAQLPTGDTASHVSLGNHGHSYAATTHNHPGSDITGTINIAQLPTGDTVSHVSLGNHGHSGFASSSHDHNATYLPLSGGTITGNLTTGSLYASNVYTGYIYKNGTLELVADSQIHFYVNTINHKAIWWINGFYPHVDNWMRLGNPANKWTDIYLQNSPTVGSDERTKENILTLDNTHIDLIKNLNPVQYKLKDYTVPAQINPDTGEVIAEQINHTFLRTHYGFISQQLKQAMTLSGITDCAAYINNVESDTFGIRYEELIAPLVKTVQSLLSEVELLKQRIQTLENN